MTPNSLTLILLPLTTGLEIALLSSIQSLSYSIKIKMNALM